MRVRELSRCVCDGRHRRGVLVARRQWNGAGPGTKNPELNHPTTSRVTQPAPSPRRAGRQHPAQAVIAITAASVGNRYSIGG